MISKKNYFLLYKDNNIKTTKIIKQMKNIPNNKYKIKINKYNNFKI